MVLILVSVLKVVESVCSNYWIQNWTALLIVDIVHDLADLPDMSCRVCQRCFGLLILFMESEYNFAFEFRIKVLTLFLQWAY